MSSTKAKGPTVLLTLGLVFGVPAAAARAASPPAGEAAGRQPLTHEALWLMKRVGAPAVSPDGRWAVFPLAEPSYDEKKEASDLWIVPVDASGSPRRLTSSKGGEGTAAWSPDGRRVAFTAKREDDEVAQLYVLDVAGGGEARRVTSVPLAARAPLWSPDGTRILYQAGAYPGAADADANRKIAGERKDPKSKVRIYDTFPIRRWDRWLDDAQTHLFITSADGEGQPRDLLAGTDLAKLPGFGGPTGEGSTEDLQAAWTPDGQAVLFVVTTNRVAAAHAPLEMHVYSVPAAGGEPQRLTTGNATHADPKFSPDGRTLCLRVSEEWGRLYALDRVACTPWPWARAPRVVSAAFDRSVGDFAFSADGRTLYLSAEDQGFVKLFALPVAGGKATPIVESRGAFGGLAVAEKAAAPAIVATWQSSVSPAELVRVDPTSGTQERLTSFNVEAAKGLGWEPLQEMWWEAPSGRRIHSFLALPPGFDPAKRYPLLVLIHGGHANMWRDSITLRWNYHLLASPGYVVLMTDYRGSTGYGEAFTLDILKDPLRGPADDVNGAADEAIRRFPYIDGTRQAAGGASYGGHLANWLEATTTRYRCLISHAGLSSLTTQWATSDTIHHREVMMGAPFWEDTKSWLDQSPIFHAKDFKTPMLLSVGESDFRVPMNNTLEMYAVLQRMKVPARLLVWPDENHWILKGENSRVFYREVHDWLGRWLAE